MIFHHLRVQAIGHNWFAAGIDYRPQQLPLTPRPKRLRFMLARFMESVVHTAGGPTISVASIVLRRR